MPVIAAFAIASRSAQRTGIEVPLLGNVIMAMSNAQPRDAHQVGSSTSSARRNTRRPASSSSQETTSVPASAGPSTLGRTHDGCRRPSPRSGSSTSTTENSRPPPNCATRSMPRMTATGVGKRSRRELAAEHTRRHTTEILDRADLTSIASALLLNGTAALFCVECDPAARRRSGGSAAYRMVVR